MPTAHADIATTRAERHLKQLCGHLDQPSHHSGHSTRERAGGPSAHQVSRADTHGVIDFGNAQCTLDASDDSLSIALVAETGDELDRLQRIMAARLEIIGRRDHLIVTWT
jgi:hypothetical protein